MHTYSYAKLFDSQIVLNHVFYIATTYAFLFVSPSGGPFMFVIIG